MEKINVKNMNAIKELSVDPIEGGGIILFVGGQGCGKSTALTAIKKRLGGQATSTSIDLQPRDGTSRGEVWIGSAKMTVTRGRKVNTGELDVQHLEGKFDIGDLVDPQIKDPIAADLARIKALIVLSGATANPADFADAVGGQEAFDELGIDCDTTDPIVLAGRTARALHTTARKIEKRATAEFAAAKVKQGEADKVDKTVESDRDVLQGAYDGAHVMVSKMAAKQSQYTEQQTAIRSAYASLEKTTGAYTGPSQAEAEKSLADQTYSEAAKFKEIEKARADLNRAENELTSIRGHQERAADVLKLTISHDETVASLNGIIASAQLEPIADATLEAADRAMDSARQAVELGVTVRAAEVAAVHAGEHRIAAEDLQERAETLRNQSKGVDKVLSGLIQAGNLRIDEGRIVTATDPGSELFAELSDGERAALAVEVTVPNLPEDGLLIVPQWMWEGWTKSTQDMVWKKCKKHGVVMLTAEARDGELAVEVYEGSQSKPQG